MKGRRPRQHPPTSHGGEKRKKAHDHCASLQLLLCDSETTEVIEAKATQHHHGKFHARDAVASEHNHFEAGNRSKQQNQRSKSKCPCHHDRNPNAKAQAKSAVLAPEEAKNCPRYHRCLEIATHAAPELSCREANPTDGTKSIGKEQLHKPFGRKGEMSKL